MVRIQIKDLLIHYSSCGVFLIARKAGCSHGVPVPASKPAGIEAPTDCIT